MPRLLPCGVTLTAEAAFSAATGTYGAWNAGRWDIETWGPDVTYVEITNYLRSLSTHRRFSRDVQAWEAGSAAAVLDNVDGRFDPDNLAGPYVTAGVTGIRPWRPVRFQATWGGVTYPIYTGYTEDFVEVWAPAHADSEVTMPCTDEYARLAGFDGLELLPQGAGERAGLRIHRILNNAGHAGNRNIAVGRNTMQATTLAANAVTELKLVADSEGGAVYVDAAGTVVFEDQYALLENTRSSSIQATFGDGSGPELPCADIKVANGGDLIKNIAAFAMVGSTAQIASDPTSRALYQDRRETRTDLVCETDAQALGLATFWVERFKQPERRFSQIVVKPLRDPARLWPQVLGRRVRDLIRVVARPIGGRTMTRDCHIAGIHHDTDGEDWVTTFDLWPASVYQTYATSRWDAATWDTSSWFF